MAGFVGCLLALQLRLFLPLLLTLSSPGTLNNRSSEEERTDRFETLADLDLRRRVATGDLVMADDGCAFGLTNDNKLVSDRGLATRAAAYHLSGYHLLANTPCLLPYTTTCCLHPGLPFP